MKKIFLFWFALICLPFSFTIDQQTNQMPQLLIRLDDIGMNHSVDMALQKVASAGYPVSASVQFACPGPEMDSLFDMNSNMMHDATGHPIVGQHRQTELNMLLSPAFKDMIDRKFRLENYQQLLSTKDITVLKPLTMLSYPSSRSLPPGVALQHRHKSSLLEECG